MIGIPLFVYAIVVVFAFAVIVGLLIFVYKNSGSAGTTSTTGARGNRKTDDVAIVPADDDGEEDAPRVRAGPRKGFRARPVGARAKRRPVRVVEEPSSSEDEREVAEAMYKEELEKEEKVSQGGSTKKVGAKKQRKLEAKEAKRQEREAFAERKKKQQEREQEEMEERKRRKEKEEEEEKKRALEEKLWKEEREKKAKAELDQWRNFIEVESEGSIQSELEAKKERLKDFASHIKAEKVVMLEDLAATFELKTAEVIKEIESLEAAGELSGVIDERGKYIYVTPSEMAAVAKFIKFRGRVSIEEIARESNKLIDLNPSKAQQSE